MLARGWGLGENPWLVASVAPQRHPLRLWLPHAEATAGTVLGRHCLDQGQQSLGISVQPFSSNWALESPSAYSHGKQELRKHPTSHSAGGNVPWCSCCGRRCGSASENGEVNYDTIQQFHFWVYSKRIESKDSNRYYTPCS